VLLLAVTLTGCAAMQKPWGKCALGGAVIGAAAGGTAGGVAANNEAFNNGAKDDETRGAAIGIGIVSGAALGAVLGHLLCDEAPPPPAPAPPPPPPPAPAPKPVVLKGTHFDFDRSEIRPEGRAALAETVRSLRENPRLRVVANGYTDSIGTEAYNMKLSQRRADAVKRYLVSEGIAADRIDTRAFGESQPVADNSTEAGRAENRRVEVTPLP
jgi:OOP family OmpA-OmpF porin